MDEEFLENIFIDYEKELFEQFGHPIKSNYFNSFFNRENYTGY